MSLIEQWDKYTDMAKKGMSGKEGTGWFGKDNWLWFDCLPCESTRSSLTSGVLNWSQGSTSWLSISS